MVLEKGSETVAWGDRGSVPVLHRKHFGPGGDWEGREQIFVFFKAQSFKTLLFPQLLCLSLRRTT